MADSLLRLLAGVSREELGDPDAAAAVIRRTVRMMAAYTVVAGVTVFFVSIPSFMGIDGGLHTENFRAFLWVGDPLFDCAAISLHQRVALWDCGILQCGKSSIPLVRTTD